LTKHAYYSQGYPETFKISLIILLLLSLLVVAHCVTVMNTNSQHSKLGDRSKIGNCAGAMNRVDVLHLMMEFCKMKRCFGGYFLPKRLLLVCQLVQMPKQIRYQISINLWHQACYGFARSSKVAYMVWHRDGTGQDFCSPARLDLT